MATSTTSSAAVRAAFAGFIDYAGLFPPAQLEMEAALAEYTAARDGTQAWMLARFIVPEVRLPELPQRAPASLSLSVIVGTTDDSRTWFATVQASLERIAAHRAAGIAIEALELPLPQPLSQRETYDAAIGQYSAALARSGLGDLPSYIELPQHERRSALLPGALASMKRHRLCAKLRCAGPAAASIPPVDDIATFLRTAAEENVPFKATAGLHHPVHGYNEQSGFVMHGFLNVLTAAALVREKANEDTVIASLEDEDVAHFALDQDGLRWRDTVMGEAALRDTRANSFHCYGSCSFKEPVDDLIALGLIA